MRGDVGPDHLRRVVPGAIVDDDDLEAEPNLFRRAANRLERGADCERFGSEAERNGNARSETQLGERSRVEPDLASQPNDKIDARSVDLRRGTRKEITVSETWETEL